MQTCIYIYIYIYIIIYIYIYILIVYIYIYGWIRCGITPYRGWLHWYLYQRPHHHTIKPEVYNTHQWLKPKLHQTRSPTHHSRIDVSFCDHGTLGRARAMVESTVRGPRPSHFWSPGSSNRQ